MTLRQFLVSYGSAALAFLVLDAAWLSTMTARLYRPGMGHLMMDRFSVAPALVFYLLYLVGVIVFVVGPAVASQRWLSALGMGAFFGLVCYATYNLTNMATLRDWPLRMSLIDMAWGAVATGLASLAAWRACLAFGGVDGGASAP